MSDPNSINLGDGAPGKQKIGAEFGATASTNAWSAESSRKKVQPEKTNQPKDFKVAFLLSVFLGMLAADRFYLGKTGSALLKLLTAGGFYVWWVFDFVQLARGKATDSEGRVLSLDDSDKTLVRVMKWVGLALGVVFVISIVGALIQGGTAP